MWSIEKIIHVVRLRLNAGREISPLLLEQLGLYGVDLEDIAIYDNTQEILKKGICDG